MRSKLGSVSVEKDQLTGEVNALKLEVIGKKGSKMKIVHNNFKTGDLM